jgi:hypothetical protein
MKMENMVVELEESVERAGAGANVGGFPCALVYVLVHGPVPPTVQQ